MIVLKNSPEEIPLEKDLILRRLGFNSTQSILTSKIATLIQEETDRFSSLVQYQSKYNKYSLDYTDTSHVRITTLDVIFSSKSLTKHLSCSQKGSLFICSLGSAVEDQIKKHEKNKEQTRGVILDSIASVAVEALAQQVNNKIIKDATKENYTTTRRFSPGYKDWNLSDQRLLFQLLTPADIGVMLTETFIMNPEKSITGIIGWYKETLMDDH